MMANAPIAQKSGFASAIGTGKPAAAMEGMGMDFLALLEQAEAMPMEAEIMPGVIPATPVPVAQQPVVLAEPSPALLPSADMPLPEADMPSLEGDGSGTSASAGGPAVPVASTGAAVSPLLPIEKALAQPAAAKLIGTASALPHLALAMGGTEEASPVTEGSKAGRVDKDKKSAAPEAVATEPVASSGLAMSLLQNIEQLAPATSDSAGDKEGAVSALPGNPQAAALKVFTLPPAALRQAAALPEQAAEPAQQQALERLASVAAPKDAAPPETAQAPEKAAPNAAVHRKLEATEVSVPVAVPVVDADAAEKTSAPAPRRTGGAQQTESSTASASAALAPALSTAAPLAPLAQPAVADVAAPAMAAPVADTAAMLGEQVIDMGVEGQWIDRMAREIADISAGTGRASFTLNPDHLGRLQVEILQRDEGADVRLIAETEDAVNALSQGRHQLQQDARLQSARINEVQIERSSGNSDNAPVARSAATSGQELAQQQSQSQSQAFHKRPLIESVSSRARGEEPGESAENAASSRNARYA